MTGTGSAVRKSGDPFVWRRKIQFLVIGTVAAVALTGCGGKQTGDYDRIGIDLNTVMIGLIQTDEPTKWEKIDRRFYLYAAPEGGEPLRELPEINTDAGRQGPMFMLGDYDQRTGEQLFEGTAWLEVRAKREGEQNLEALKPRMQVTAGLPGLRAENYQSISEAAGEDGMKAYFHLYGHLQRFDYGAFDSKNWIKAQPDGWTDRRRYVMLEDLLSRHQFHGMERETLNQLLGYSGPPKAGESEEEYLIGFISVDTFQLKFRLMDNRVTQMWFVTH